MKTDPKPWGVGDPCPNDGGPLTLIPAATDAQRAAAARTDSNAFIPVPPTHDSADHAFIEEHGALYRCAVCKYQARADAPPPPPPAPVSEPAS